MMLFLPIVLLSVFFYSSEVHVVVGLRCHSRASGIVMGCQYCLAPTQ